MNVTVTHTSTHRRPAPDCPVRIVWILLLFLWRLNGLDHSTRAPHSNRKRWYVLCHSGSGTDCATLPNVYAWKNDDIASDPTIVSNGDRVTELDELPPGKHARHMACAENAHVGAEHDSITNDHDTRVEDGHADK